MNERKGRISKKTVLAAIIVMFHVMPWVRAIDESDGGEWTADNTRERNFDGEGVERHIGDGNVGENDGEGRTEEGDATEGSIGEEDGIESAHFSDNDAGSSGQGNEGSMGGDAKDRHQDGDGEDGGVDERDGENELHQGERMRLFKYDPVKVGHEQYVEISPGRYVKMKTVAVRPPVFEILNFLTPEECTTIKNLALEVGLKSSSTVYSTLDQSGIDESKVTYTESEWTPVLEKCDMDSDQKLDFTEVLKCMPGLEEGEVVPPLVLDRLYTNLTLDLDSDGFIDAKELWLINLPNKTEQIKGVLNHWRKTGEVPAEVGRGRSRISHQAWISWTQDVDPVVEEIRERVTALTKLDWRIVHSSEQIQVVRYYPGGRYHAHFDSHEPSPDTLCDHTKYILYPEDTSSTRICRYMTILYYLEDVEEGGETAFPTADMDNETLSLMDYDRHDLTRHCYKNLVVKPERGKAVLWYNHFLDSETGWISNLDKFSLHGGCDVIKGTKWIANNWIRVDDQYDRQMAFHEAIFRETTETPDRTQEGSEEKRGETFDSSSTEQGATSTTIDENTEEKSSSSQVPPDGSAPSQDRSDSNDKPSAAHAEL